MTQPATRGATLPGPLPTRETRVRTRLVEVVVPVYNEQHTVETCVRRLQAYLDETFPYDYLITIADNASVDGTWEVATRLSEELPRVRAVHLALKGRGRALRQVWGASEADVVAYMDVDLSTGLEAFLPLVAPLLSGHSDLAIGSRLHHGSAVTRGPKRELISRGYNLLLRATMAARFSDAQCGFKAGRTEVVKRLLDEVEDNAWFFDTELLLLAERTGLRIHEVPVDWVDDPDSRVDVVRTALDDLRGMARIARRSLTRPGGAGTARAERLPPGLGWQLASFAVVGTVSTLAYVLLFLGLRQLMPALPANALALGATAVANTAANRRFTFGVTGRRDALRHQVEGGIAFLIGLVLSSGAIGLLHAVRPGVGHGVELAVLVGANAVATVLRFLLLRVWVFNPRRGR
ncbi:bifunctional glycosyltransferase family 2/GtrA family protein [Kitasatospora camelliae]|uniref:dolichyl-phosphate beta-glucosyltransferase n=1 Tax=Kitasatospora camelliae TaxID=3156397 RepID=A0AAU8K099_9ACTN